MKGKMKKLATLALAAIMVLAMGMTAFAGNQEVDTGKGGSASITITNPKAGRIYTVYKVFNATVDPSNSTNVSYSVINENESLDGTGFNVDANGIVTTAENDTLSPTEVTALTTYAKKINMVVATQESNGNQLVFNGLEYGYYLIDAGNNMAVSIDTTNTNMTVNDKNPSLPSIPEGDHGGKHANDNFVEAGQTVTYTVTFSTTNYATRENQAPEKIYKYTVNDSLPKWMSDVTLTSVKVMAALEEDAEVLANISVTGNQFAETKKFDVNWTTDGTVNGTHLYPDGAILEVVYTAKIVAEDGEIITAGNYQNDVALTWNSKEWNPDNPDPEIPDDHDDVYTGSISVLKYANGNEANVLSDVEFVLLDTEVTGGSIPEVAKYYKANEDGSVSWVTASENPTKYKTNEEGTLTFNGLEPGKTYYVYETATLPGYNRLVGTVAVKIPEIVDVKNPTETELAALAVRQPIENNTGAELPSTGGIGTTIFYVVGGILVIGAGILLITKKRMGKNN